MKAVKLIKYGQDPSCFQITETEKPIPQAGEVLIKVEGFGLNYADVMARLGQYRDAPPLPAVLGYDVVGIIENVGPGVDRNTYDIALPASGTKIKAVGGGQWSGDPNLVYAR